MCVKGTKTFSLHKRQFSVLTVILCDCDRTQMLPLTDQDGSCHCCYDKILLVSKLSFFVQCKKLQLITLQNFNIQTYVTLDSGINVAPGITVAPPPKNFHITILILFYINLGIAVIFYIFIFIFKKIQKLISVPLCLFRSLE